MKLSKKIGFNALASFLLVFGITACSELPERSTTTTTTTTITPSGNIEFTQEYLDGKILYSVSLDDYSDRNASEWIMETFVFTRDTFDFYDGTFDITGSVDLLGSYAIDTKYFELYADNNNSAVLQIQSSTTTTAKVCFEDTREESNTCIDNEEADVYFFTNKEEAQAFYDSKVSTSEATVGFTTEWLNGKTLYAYSEYDSCVLETIYTESTITQNEYTLHDDGNMTNGCTDDYGVFVNAGYSIDSEGVMTWENLSNWSFKLNSISPDYATITDPDGTYKAYFSKEDLLSSLANAGTSENNETNTTIALGYTSEWLNGRTLYNTYYEDETNTWELGVWTFTDTIVTAYLDTNISDKTTVEYSITEEGYITFIAPWNTQTEYIKIAQETEDYQQLCWSDSLADIENCSGTDEYFYFDYEKAKAVVAEKNIDVLANSESVTIAG